ncbi:MAG: GHKL domain-containing protein [Epsilonproteobacteria bacterium]|nr:GHKL domain-containing protein [Campylobacterota bacterium]
MLDKKLLDNLDQDDKEQFLQGLQEIIEHSYRLEEEFKSLKTIISNIIDFLPNALWVFEKNGEVFIQNSEAQKITELITRINSNLPSSEVEFEGKIYLIKSRQAEDKLIISATDITVQKRSERLASMGKIAAHLSHEIRNPIGSISLLAGTLMNRVKLENKPIVLEIKKSIYRVERIIKSTLLFTKGVQINKAPFSLINLQEMIEDASEYYDASKEIHLKVNFDDKSIEADFDLLIIVMQNFLYNAIDAIEETEDEEGNITFSHQTEGEYQTFTIKDNGKAIEDKSILYEPFQSTKVKGSGLGLALSLEIIKAHDGKIELLNGEKGFKIWIR